MVYIRTDANCQIATGHVMRCLTIADELKKQNKDVCFVVSDNESLRIIQENGYKTINMHDAWNAPDIEKEYSVLCKYAKNKDVLLVDTYYIKNDYLNKFRAVFKLVIFDDLFTEKKNADIIINYNVFFRRFDYNGRYGKSDCKLLLGEKYVPLRSQFGLIQKHNFVCEHDKTQVLLICGGGDRENMILTVLRWMQKNQNRMFCRCEWMVVIGSYYPYKDELLTIASENQNIFVKINISNMAELMNQCDLCISAASTVLYECCAMLLPTLFFIVAEDQVYDAEWFSKNEMMLYCGNFVVEKEQSLKKLEKNMISIFRNRKMQQEMKNQMKKFLDTYGAKRIVDEILTDRGEQMWKN